MKIQKVINFIKMIFLLESDLIESISNLLQSAINLEELEAFEMTKEILQKTKSTSNHPFENMGTEKKIKVLNAPISMAKLVEQQEKEVTNYRWQSNRDKVKQQLSQDLRIEVNYNSNLKTDNSG